MRHVPSAMRLRHVPRAICHVARLISFYGHCILPPLHFAATLRLCAHGLWILFAVTKLKPNDSGREVGWLAGWLVCQRHNQFA